YPVAPAGDRRQAEADHIMVSVEQQQQGVIVAAAAYAAGLGATVEQHSQALGVGGLPLLLGHRLTRRRQPADLVHIQLLVIFADQEAAPAQDRIVMAQADQIAGEVHQLTLILIQIPVDPAQLVILTVDVVVALLSAGELVSSQQHGRALGKQQRGQQI